MTSGTTSDQRRLPSRKDGAASAWAARHEELALTASCSREVTQRIAFHLHRFAEYLSTYGHEQLASVLGRRRSLSRRDATDPAAGQRD